MKHAVVVTVLVVLAVSPCARAEPAESTVVPVPRWTPGPSNPPVFGPPEMVDLRRVGAPNARELPDETPWQETGEGIADLLAAEVRQAGGEIEEVGDGLLVSGSAKAVELARRRVAAIDRFLTGRARVGVTLAALPPREAPGPLDGRAVGSMLEKGTASLVWAGRFELRRGEGAFRETLVERSFVRSHDAEVAQDAAIMTLETALLRTGRRVYVACRPLAGGQAVVTLSLGLSRAPETLRAVKTGTGPLELPEVPFLSLTTDVRLAAGTSEVLLVDHPFDSGLLAIVVSLQALPPSDDLPFTLVDVAARVGHPDLVDATATLGAGILPYRVSRRGGYDEDYLPSSGGRRTEVVESLLTALGETGATLVQLSPVVVAIAGPEEARARARAVLARVDTRGRVERETFRLPWERLATSTFFDPLTGAVAPEVLRRTAGTDAGPERTGLLVAPTAGRTPLLLLHGTWRHYLESMEVEIAQGAAMVRPVVGAHMDGELVVVRGDDVRGWVRPHVSVSSSVLLGIESRDLEVRRDILGKRTDEWGHLLDVIHTTDAGTQLVMDVKQTTDLHRVGESAVLDLWSR